MKVLCSLKKGQLIRKGVLFGNEVNTMVSHRDKVRKCPKHIVWCGLMREASVVSRYDLV